MVGGKKNKQKSNKVFSGVLITLVFFLVFFVCFVTIKEIVNRRLVDKEITALNDEVSTLKLEQEAFLNSVDHYNSDFFVEREARSKLNLKKEGESVVVVKLDDINNVKAIKAEEDVGSRDSASNVVKWWRYFFDQG